MTVTLDQQARMDSESVVLVRCPNCGVEYGIKRRILDDRRRNGLPFWCTNGHQLCYEETEEIRLRRERDRLKQEIARVEQEASEAWRAKERAESLLRTYKKRSTAGVCPCCSRTFSNMARHMKTKHPAFSGNIVPIKAAS